MPGWMRPFWMRAKESGNLGISLRAVTYTVRDYSGLAHYPIPRTCPRYLSKDQYAAYLRDYAFYFGLSFIANTRVMRVCQGAGNENSGWKVDTKMKPGRRGPW